MAARTTRGTGTAAAAAAAAAGGSGTEPVTPYVAITDSNMAKFLVILKSSQYLGASSISLYLHESAEVWYKQGDTFIVNSTLSGLLNHLKAIFRSFEFAFVHNVDFSTAEQCSDAAEMISAQKDLWSILNGSTGGDAQLTVKSFTRQTVCDAMHALKANELKLVSNIREQLDTVITAMRAVGIGTSQPHFMIAKVTCLITIYNSYDDVTSKHKDEDFKKQLVYDILKSTKKNNTIYTSLILLKEIDTAQYNALDWVGFTGFIYQLYSAHTMDNGAKAPTAVSYGGDASKGADLPLSKNAKKKSKKAELASEEKVVNVPSLSSFSGVDFTSMTKKQTAEIVKIISEKTGKSFLNSQQIKALEAKAVKDSSYSNASNWTPPVKGGGKGSGKPFTKYCDVCYQRKGYTTHNHNTEDHIDFSTGGAAFGGGASWQAFT